MVWKLTQLHLEINALKIFEYFRGIFQNEPGKVLMTVTKAALVLCGEGRRFETFSVKKDTDFPNLSPHNPDLSVISSNMNMLPQCQYKNPFLRAL